MADRRPEVGRPWATYRLQLGEHLDFAGAAGLLDYLAALGITHLYLSPVLQARPGSAHGYDVADPTQVSAELGGEAGLRALAEQAHAAGLGVVIDIVPNHLGAGIHTPRWVELLATGAAGPAARFFDVDWDPPLPGAAGKVLLPVLDAPYGQVLHEGRLTVVTEEGTVRLAFADQRFPLSAETVAAVERAGGPDAVNGRPGAPESWDRLHELLESQHFRLLHWRTGERLLNYRRFFSITDLPGVRVEAEDVFDATHEKIIELCADGVVDGLRVDHVDGLRDPGRYLERLAARAPGQWLLVEKILQAAGEEGAERLPAEWPVAGTTGYETANELLGLFVDPAATDDLDTVDEAFGGPGGAPRWQVAAAKREVLEDELAAELDRGARRLWQLTQRERTVRDVTEEQCREALAGLVAALPVYRTYVDPETGAARAEDVARIDDAAAAAGDSLLVGYLADVLAGRVGDDTLAAALRAGTQQLSGAAMAKGFEDRLLYRQRRLLAVNEVGGAPEWLGRSAGVFHASNERRAERRPRTMVTTATHDTKRSEDVRLRIAALSELSSRWRAEGPAWAELAEAHRRATAAGPAPDAGMLLLVFQTLVGVWPLGGAPDAALTARVQAYAVKAAREAAERTSWRDPDEEFEEALEAFVARVVDREIAGELTDRIAALANEAAEIAMVSGLAQTLLRCTVPGIPDTYQGTETWDDSLVDPDNRRAVRFAASAAWLAELDRWGEAGALFDARADGRVKLWVLSRALRTRAAYPGCFGPAGGYEPVAVTGAWAGHLLAFAREAPDGAAAVVVAPRLPGAVMGAGAAGPVQPPLGARWGDTAVVLPGEVSAWRDQLTGRRLPAGRTAAATLLSDLPVALLTPA